MKPDNEGKFIFDFNSFVYSEDRSNFLVSNVPTFQVAFL